MKRMHLIAGAVLPWATLGLSSAAMAQQTAPAADDASLTEIVVTAQKRAQNLQDVSATVQALTGEDLAKAGITDVSRLEQMAPGIVFAKGGNDSKIALRGANSNSTFAGNTSIVGVFVDGVYKPRASQQSRAFFDIERLEVLRGPQGTLYGRGWHSHLRCGVSAPVHGHRKRPW